MLCRKLSLFADAFVAIDGSKFKAVNNRDRNFTKAKLKGRLRQIDQSIERYLGQLESADRHPDELTAAKHERLETKIGKLKEEIGRLEKLEVASRARPTSFADRPGFAFDGDEREGNGDGGLQRAVCGGCETSSDS